MRILYSSEGPIDTLLQIADTPVLDGDVISKSDRNEFYRLGWVARCEGYNIITNAGREVVTALKLVKPKPVDMAAELNRLYKVPS